LVRAELPFPLVVLAQFFWTFQAIALEKEDVDR
jgi:hypothetical protein